VRLTSFEKARGVQRRVPRALDVHSEGNWHESKPGTPGDRHASSDPGVGEYTPEELSLLRAADAYRQRTGRRFLTLTEILGVVKAMGYRLPDSAPSG
jgi:hypothetical protein